MTKKEKTVIILLIIITIVVIYFSVGKNKDNADEKLAKCIGSKSTIYVSIGCLACESQKALFGKNFQYLNVVDCKQDPAKCADGNITHVPAWEINGEKYEGVHSTENLKKLTGC